MKALYETCNPTSQCAGLVCTNRSMPYTPVSNRNFMSQGPVEIVVQLYNYTGKKNTSHTLILERASETITTTNERPLIHQSCHSKLNAADITWITAQPGVVSVEPLLQPQLLDEIQGQILAGHLTANGAQPLGPGYLTWLTGTVGFPTTSECLSYRGNR